jgi:hypothetical protein
MLDGLPDLAIDDLYTKITLATETRQFEPSDCAVEEACVGGIGPRRLLRFGVMIPNLGAGDVFVGPPEDSPDLYEFSACHGHYHFKDFATYELLDGGGGVVGFGHKQAFCMMDSFRYDPAAASGRGYDCEYQGISVNYADVYSEDLDCQWVDVTDVSPGEYTLRITVDPLGHFAEGSEHPNVAEVSVTVTPP